VRSRTLSVMGRASVLGLCVAPVIGHAQESPPAAATNNSAGPVLEEVVVAGYRLSLTEATEAKRESTNFTDSVFAEDIGKFPDLNIAESLNRIPGVQLTRETNGEGLNIAIRGLGTNFTKVTLNGGQVAVASSGRTDAQGQNREVDLDLFPTELFTRLDVNKTPVASMIEGGVAGTVNMRSARAFDNPGAHVTYQLQGGYDEIGEELSPRGALMGSWTNDKFGVLLGVAGVRNKSTTEGFETIGWTNPNLSDAQCGVAAVDHDNNPATAAQNICQYGVGGNNWNIPGTVPAGVGNGLTPGTVIDRAFLEANNPGLTARQIGDALIPRLGRPAYSSGTRDRVSGLLSFEYRPTESLSFYLDTLYADANREFDRLDVNFIGRSGNAIPLNMQVDSNNVVTSATFANAQFFLEARPYDEEVDFYNVNPGAHFDLNESVAFDVQANKSRSTFFREAPTLLFNTPLGQGVTVEYANAGGDIPSITTNYNLNDPNAGWTWAGGRLNIQNERRVTETEGARFDVRFGDDQQNVKVGIAYDDVSRVIQAYDNSARWEDVACRGGLDPNGNSPTTGRANCDGLNPNAAIPQSALASYLLPGPYGFITVDFDRFFADTNYDALNASAPRSNSAATAASSGAISEKTYGAYVEVNGESEFMGHALRFNGGGRFVKTDQLITGPVTIGTNIVDQSLPSDYDQFLPSFNVALNVTDDIVARMSGSRTLTRANPSAMLPATRFSDPVALQASQGNPNLSPYLSTNFDLGGEWYTGEEGYIGLSLFNKQLTGFTVEGTNTIPFSALGIPFDTLTPQQQDAINQRGGPAVSTVVVSQQVNASGTLTIRGYEVTWVQPLSFLLDGFGFSTNYTRVTQKGDGTGVPAQAIGISPHTANGTVYYEFGAASIRASYVWNDAQISSGVNQNGIPLAQLYTDARGQLDLSASYEFDWLPTSPQITLNAINVTSEPQRQTFQFDNAAFTYYDPGYSILLGVRGRF